MSQGYEQFLVAEFWGAINQMRPSFWKNALCLGVGTDLYFPEQGGAHKTRKAKESCLRCPVRIDCFEYAYEAKLEDGVWGGSSSIERKEWHDAGLDVERAWEAFNQT